MYVVLPATPSIAVPPIHWLDSTVAPKFPQGLSLKVPSKPFGGPDAHNKQLRKLLFPMEVK